MNTIKYFFTVIGLIAMFSGFSMTSCKSGDTTKPVINLIEPEEGDSLKPGSDVHFDIELSDNEMLGSYKVDIHSNFDGHEHAQQRVAAEDESVPFAFSKSWDLSGKRNADIHHHEIIIPQNAAEGKYHLMVYCTDAAGNEAHIAVNVVLSHDASTHEHEE
jgi:hypothetical protein